MQGVNDRDGGGNRQARSVGAFAKAVQQFGFRRSRQRPLRDPCGDLFNVPFVHGSSLCDLPPKGDGSFAGIVRHELLPNGRYDKARGPKKGAYPNRYWLEGNHIE